jgi:DNA-binding transcriptional regulator PaaX
MRLSIDQRSRIVAIYFEQRLHFMKIKYEKLINIAAEIGINVSERKVRKFVERFLITGNLNEKIINDEVIILMIILSRKTK